MFNIIYCQKRDTDEGKPIILQATGVICYGFEVIKDKHYIDGVRTLKLNNIYYPVSVAGELRYETRTEIIECVNKIIIDGVIYFES